MKASATMTVERGLATALADRLIKTETLVETHADLETIRALHARTPSHALPRALEHILRLMDPENPERAALIEEGTLALEQARAAEKRRSDAVSSGPFVRQPVVYDQVVQLSVETGLEEDPSWHLPPLFGNNWANLAPDAAKDAIARISTAFPDSYGPGTIEGIRAVREIPMGCYPGFRTVEVLFRFDTRPPISAVYLLGSHLVFWITGASPGLHNLNTQKSDDNALYLDVSTADKAAEYLRFFCASVHAEEGPFRIVETEEELLAHLHEDTSPEEVLAKLGPIHPSRIENETGEAAWRATAIVLYGPAIFEAQFELKHTGMVEMVEDTPITGAVTPLRQVMIHGLRQPRGSD